MPKPSPAEIEALIPMVQTLVAQRFHGVPDHVAGRDDLVQIGMEAICAALSRWDAERGPLRPFAYRRAWGAIQDWLRVTSPGGRGHVGEYVVLSLDMPVGDEEGTATLGDTIPVEDAPMDPFITAAIEQAVSGCSLDAQSAFALHVEEDMTGLEIGRLMGVTESRVSQWLTQCRDAIAAHPALDGVL